MLCWLRQKNTNKNHSFLNQFCAQSSVDPTHTVIQNARSRLLIRKWSSYRKINSFSSKAKLFLEATKTRPHFSLPKVIIQVQTGLEYSTG